LEQVKQFKTTGQMVLELAFDPSGKFLAAGTADSAVKVFDVARGYQTHNFTGGHRGVITSLLFFPEADSLRLVSAAEDCQVKVWDLVLRAEIGHMKGHQALVTSLTFSGSTLVSCGKDGKLAFWNAKDNFQQLSMIKYSKTEDELNAVIVMHSKDSLPYLVVGGASGSLSVYNLTEGKVCSTVATTPNEITKLFPLSKQRFLVLNAD